MVEVGRLANGVGSPKLPLPEDVPDEEEPWLAEEWAADEADEL
ncbi:MAG TPA: hypothetical protein VG405_00715 [Solirubrobacteraceae bacterium]|nr:hypothetical protein [Solirubrobacteraceae bacterium]